MYRGLLLGLCVVGLASATASGPAVSAAAGVKVGVLSCNVDGGFGLILGSSKDIRCNYAPTSGTGERYSGDITKIGVDIGFTKGGILVWNVIAPTGAAIWATLTALSAPCARWLPT